MAETKPLSVEDIVATATTLTEQTRKQLIAFRKTVYEIADQVLQQIISRYPEISTAEGASINVVVPYLPFMEMERFAIFYIDRVQLADGSVVLAICFLADSKAATPVFLALPKEDNGRNFILDRLIIGSRDRNDVEEPGLSRLFDFLKLVAADLPAVLDTIEIWPAKTSAA